jgi:methylated-DNA-[protein]-cysteine S-methyltransferase
MSGEPDFQEMFKQNMIQLESIQADIGRKITEKSEFSNGVYQVVRKIPRGKIISYKEVAKRAGHSRAWRGVGNILNKNRDSKIPCHRVIKSDGEIGGYNLGTKRKIYLLRKEGIKINGNRIF